MPKRSDTRDAAKKAYVERREKGEKVNLRELAEQIGANYKTLREWKRKDAWDDAVTAPKKKRGGQPGNKNSKGKRNAAGSHKGAPKGNRNAEKDGAYSRVFLDMLPDEELDLIDRTPLEVREALEQEMKILKYRERKILAKIEDYENAEEGTTYLSAVTEIHGNAQDFRGLYGDYRTSESALGGSAWRKGKHSTRTTARKRAAWSGLDS